MLRGRSPSPFFVAMPSSAFAHHSAHGSHFIQGARSPPLIHLPCVSWPIRNLVPSAPKSHMARSIDFEMDPRTSGVAWFLTFTNCSGENAVHLCDRFRLSQRSLSRFCVSLVRCTPVFSGFSRSPAVGSDFISPFSHASSAVLDSRTNVN